MSFLPVSYFRVIIVNTFPSTCNYYALLTHSDVKQAIQTWEILCNAMPIKQFI